MKATQCSSLWMKSAGIVPSRILSKIVGPGGGLPAAAAVSSLMVLTKRLADETRGARV